jgi:hypothetical protein
MDFDHLYSTEGLNLPSPFTLDYEFPCTEAIMEFF